MLRLVTLILTYLTCIATQAVLTPISSGRTEGLNALHGDRRAQGTNALQGISDSLGISTAQGNRSSQANRSSQGNWLSQGSRSSHVSRAATIKNAFQEEEYKYLQDKDIPLNYFAQNSVELLKEGWSTKFCFPQWNIEGSELPSHIVCDFESADKTPIVLAHSEESEIDPPEPTSSIYLNAQGLYLSDICNTVTVKSSGIRFFRSGKACQPTLTIQNSSSLQLLKGRFQSLVVFDSKFSDMKIETVSLEVKNSSAMNLEITQKSSGLTTSKNLSDDNKSVAGINLVNTKLKSIRGNITELFSMSNVTIDYIPQTGLRIQSLFYQDQSLINNCSFGVIMEDGVQVAHSVIQLNNVRIAQANRRAFSLTFNSAVILQNVSFVRGVHGMFVTDKDSKVMLHNVTVGGKLIDHRSQFVHYRFKKLDVNVDLTMNTSECHVTSESADCDFETEEKHISLNAHDDHPDLHVTLSNAAKLEAVVTCPKSVTVTNVTGTLLSYNDCPKPTSISVTNSLLDIFVYSVNVLTMTDSEIKLVPLSSRHSIGLMNFTHTYFPMLEFNVSKPGLGSSMWKNVTVHFMDTSYTAKPLLIEDSYILNPVGGITYDHPNQTSTLRNVVFDFDSQDVIVKSGTLTVDGLHIKEFDDGGKNIFILKAGAKLVVKSITLGSLPRERMIVMADTEEQIEIENESLKTMFEGRVVILHLDRVFPYRVSADSLPCTVTHRYSEMKADVKCDYAHVNQSDVLLGHLPVKRFNNVVTVANAASLTVRDACIRRISLFNISSVDMRGQTLKCSPEFEALQVNFTGIYDEFNSFNASNFTSPYLISGMPTASTDFKLDHAKVGAILAIHGRNIIIENSKIANVTRLVAQRKMKLSNSRFGVVNSNALKIDELSEVSLVDSTIGLITRQGIESYGTLSILNTTIDGLHDHSFVLRPKSITTLTNVEIGYVVGNPFVYSPGAHLIFNNVTLGGKENLTISENMEVRGEDRDGKLTLSVFVPRYHPEEETSSEEDDIEKFMASVFSGNSSNFRYNVVVLQAHHKHFMDREDAKFKKNFKPRDQTGADDKKEIVKGVEEDLAKGNDTEDLSMNEVESMDVTQGKNDTETSVWIKTLDSKLTKRTKVSVKVSLVFDKGGYPGYEVVVIAGLCSISTLLLIFMAVYQKTLRSWVLHFVRGILPTPRPRRAADPFTQQDQLGQVIDNLQQLQDLRV